MANIDFDDIYDRISQTGQDVAKKAKDLAETTKLNASIINEKRNLACLYKKIGKLCYEEMHDDAPEIFDELFVAVSTSLAKIEENEAEKARIKHTVVCPRCSERCPDTSSFCPKCGAPLKKTSEKDEQ